jgi:hypothetical protein
MSKRAGCACVSLGGCETIRFFSFYHFFSYGIHHHCYGDRSTERKWLWRFAWTQSVL